MTRGMEGLEEEGEKERGVLEESEAAVRLQQAAVQALFRPYAEKGMLSPAPDMRRLCCFALQRMAEGGEEELQELGSQGEVARRVVGEGLVRCLGDEHLPVAAAATDALAAFCRSALGVSLIFSSDHLYKLTRSSHSQVQQRVVEAALRLANQSQHAMSAVEKLDLLQPLVAELQGVAGMGVSGTEGGGGTRAGASEEGGDALAALAACELVSEFTSSRVGVELLEPRIDEIHEALVQICTKASTPALATTEGEAPSSSAAAAAAAAARPAESSLHLGLDLLLPAALKCAARLTSPATPGVMAPLTLIQADEVAALFNSLCEAWGRSEQHVPAETVEGFFDALATYARSTHGTRLLLNPRRHIISFVLKRAFGGCGPHTSLHTVSHLVCPLLLHTVSHLVCPLLLHTVSHLVRLLLLHTVSHLVCPLLLHTVSHLEWCLRMYLCFLLTFKSLRSPILCAPPFSALPHSLHSPILCAPPFSALPHSLRSPILCTPPFSALPHSLRSPILCTPPFSALPHSLRSPILCAPPFSALPHSLRSPVVFVTPFFQASLHRLAPLHASALASIFGADCVEGSEPVQMVPVHATHTTPTLLLTFTSLHCTPLLLLPPLFCRPLFCERICIGIWSRQGGGERAGADGASACHPLFIPSPPHPTFLHTLSHTQASLHALASVFGADRVEGSEPVQIVPVHATHSGISGVDEGGGEGGGMDLEVGDDGETKLKEETFAAAAKAPGGPTLAGVFVSLLKRSEEIRVAVYRLLAAVVEREWAAMELSGSYLCYLSVVFESVPLLLVLLPLQVYRLLAAVVEREWAAVELCGDWGLVQMVTDAQAERHKAGEGHDMCGAGWGCVCCVPFSWDDQRSGWATDGAPVELCGDWGLVQMVADAQTERHKAADKLLRRVGNRVGSSGAVWGLGSGANGGDRRSGGEAQSRHSCCVAMSTAAEAQHASISFNCTAQLAEAVRRGPYLRPREIEPRPIVVTDERPPSGF
ncbi:unnamed protein product [Closterium sp. NIES-64]|nr:unnamed protein product [Closterium sp. NIES-64]